MGSRAVGPVIRRGHTKRSSAAALRHGSAPVHSHEWRDPWTTAGPSPAM